MGDLTRLPFRDHFADFLFCLGVLHHLPVDALEQLWRLARCSRKLLIYLYYALDNRPFYYRVLLAVVTPVRLLLSRIRNPIVRDVLSWCGVAFIQLPCILLGTLLKPTGLSKYISLYEDYHWVSLEGLHHHIFTGASLGSNSASPESRS